MLSNRSLRSWSWLHKWTSLICTAFLLMLCLTGLPLIFHDEIDGLLGVEAAAPTMPAETPDASLDAIVDAIHQRHPDRYLASLYYDDDHPHVLGAVLADDASGSAPQHNQFISIDTRTGLPLDDRKPSLGFTGFMLTLHANMFAGLPGELFLGLMGLLFVIAIVSGVVLYAPFMRKLDFGTVRRNRSARLKWLDLHNLLGIVTLAWAFVVGATGVMNTLSTPLFGLWAMQALPPLVAPYQGKPVPTPAEFGSVDKAVASAREALPDNEISSITFPTSRLGSPWHYLIFTKGQSRLMSRLFTPVLVDVLTGERVTAQPPSYIRALEISRPLHFGDYGGLPLKILWAVLDIATIVVLGSGLYLWLRRRRNAETPIDLLNQAQVADEPALTSPGAAP